MKNKHPWRILFYPAYWLYCLPHFVQYYSSKVREAISHLINKVFFRPAKQWEEDDEWLGI